MRKLLMATMALGLAMGSTAFAAKHSNADCQGRAQQDVSSVSPATTKNMVASLLNTESTRPNQKSGSTSKVVR
ncbi:hypothetical protein GW916_08775 [bacterium]|nr:hypothetical protein [bacterium]